ncbi:MAG: hypothetical protein ACLT77_13270 [Escherichia coli]
MTRQRLFYRLRLPQIMVGWTGALKGAPVSDNAGYASPVQFHHQRNWRFRW